LSIGVCDLAKLSLQLLYTWIDWAHKPINQKTLRLAILIGGQEKVDVHWHKDVGQKSKVGPDLRTA
jgi:hypothetical protein